MKPVNKDRQKAHDLGRMNMPFATPEKKKANSPNPAVGIGEEFWTWRHKYRERQYSKTKPTRSELAREEFWAAAAFLLDEWEWDPEGDLEHQIHVYLHELVQQMDKLKMEIEELDDERRSGDFGFFLMERKVSLQQWIDETQEILQRFQRKTDRKGNDITVVINTIDELDSLEYLGG